MNLFSFLFGLLLSKTNLLVQIMKEDLSIPVDINDKEQMLGIIKSSIGTKFMKGKDWTTWGVKFQKTQS